MLSQVIESHDLIDDAYVDGRKVADAFKARGLKNVETITIRGEKGKTDFVNVLIPGKNGKSVKGNAPTLGIIGRLGGIGARPERIGIVSDADGAITMLAAAFKLADMAKKGDALNGDVILATHICPDAPTQPHEPVPFMKSPVPMQEINKHEVTPAMDAILSVDSTKGNRLLNWKGIAITPTVKEGYILKVSEDLLNILSWTTGGVPRVIAITTQDITPYENGLYHMNSILQPCTATTAPVVGVAVTAESTVPGCGTGASHEVDIELAARFCIEVAKTFTEHKCGFYDKEEFNKLVSLYGEMKILQTPGKK